MKWKALRAVFALLPLLCLLLAAHSGFAPACAGGADALASAGEGRAAFGAPFRGCCCAACPERSAARCCDDSHAPRVGHGVDEGRRALRASAPALGKVSVVFPRLADGPSASRASSVGIAAFGANGSTLYLRNLVVLC